MCCRPDILTLCNKWFTRIFDTDFAGQLTSGSIDFVPFRLSIIHFKHHLSITHQGKAVQDSCLWLIVTISAEKHLKRMNNFDQWLVWFVNLHTKMHICFLFHFFIAKTKDWMQSQEINPVIVSVCEKVLSKHSTEYTSSYVFYSLAMDRQCQHTERQIRHRKINGAEGKE